MTAAELVLRDLIDAALQEGLCRAEPCDPPETAAGLAGDEYWCRIPAGGEDLVFRGRDGGVLQPHRISRGPVLRHGVALPPDRVLTALAGDEPHAADVAADLRLAVEHARVTLGGRARWTGDLLAGERLAATRNRPFHPTARAAVGWTADDLRRYGPQHGHAIGLDWVGVRRDRLRLGGGADSANLARLLLDDTDRSSVSGGVRDVVPVPVHPWQYEHVLPAAFADEFARGDVVPLARGVGRFHPTCSLRTLVVAHRPDLHVKLPLGVATLGAARLLPPRYLDNGERAQTTMVALLDRDPDLRGLVAVCDEAAWCGWRDTDDEFADRPGHLAAQVRTYPSTPGTVLPMAAFAAHEWGLLETTLAAAGFADPVAFFAALAEAFTAMTLGFLRRGVLPELHGQNVVVALAGGAVRRFLLRDHDTLRLYPEWMRAAGVADPGYRVRPGARQSLLLTSAEALIGYAQTLAFQVNLYGIADAISRHYRIAETVLWHHLREAVQACVDRMRLPDRIPHALLAAPTWPSRQVLRPLLRTGRSAAVSMPSATGTVPNPLLVATGVLS